MFGRLLPVLPPASGASLSGRTETLLALNPTETIRPVDFPTDSDLVNLQTLTRLPIGGATIVIGGTISINLRCGVQGYKKIQLIPFPICKIRFYYRLSSLASKSSMMIDHYTRKLRKVGYKNFFTRFALKIDVKLPPLLTLKPSLRPCAYTVAGC